MSVKKKAEQGLINATLNVLPLIACDMCFKHACVSARFALGIQAGSLLVVLASHREAEPLLHKSWQLREEIDGPDSLTTLHALHAHAQCLISLVSELANSIW